MNELVAKYHAQLADIRAAQEKALAAADAEGCTDADREKHLAEFDRLDAEKKKVSASLKRAEQLAAEKAHAEQQAARRQEEARLAIEREANTPTRPPVTQPVHVPQQFSPAASDRLTVPAEQRRHGRLKAFRGPDAELRAYQTGLWVAGCMYGHKPSLDKLVNTYGIVPQATLSTINNNLGAYFVPEVLDTAVLELTETYGVIRRLADVIPMARETWKGPRWTNAMTATWISQGNAPAQSEPGWDLIELVAKDLAAYGKMARQLNEDALVDLAEKWANAAAIAFAYAEDNAAFNGDGTSTYGGITGLFTKLALSANSACVYTATGHTTPPALTIADFGAVIGKLPMYPGIDPVWICHKEIYANSMLPLQLTAGGVTSIEIQQGAAPRFLGYDVVFSQVSPKESAATTGTIPILFGDLSMSTKVGDRRQRTLEVGMINDDMIKQLMTIFAASRVDIVNHTITDPKDSTKAGPVVALKLG